MESIEKKPDAPDTLESLAREHVELCDKQWASAGANCKMLWQNSSRIEIAGLPSFQNLNLSRQRRNS